MAEEVREIVGYEARWEYEETVPAPSEEQGQQNG